MTGAGAAAAGRLARYAPLAGLLLVLLFALLLGVWRQASFDPVGGGLEDALLDLRFRLRGPLPAPAEVVVVAIDEDALDRIGTLAPLRAALAEAIARIAAAGPRAIAVNLLLLDRTAADARLAHEIARAGAVLLAVAVTNEPEPMPAPPAPELALALAHSVFPVVAATAPGTAPPPGRTYLPHPGLAGPARLGHVNITRSDDRVARLVPLAVRLDAAEGWLPALSLAAARLALRPPGADALPALLLRPGEEVELDGRRIGTDRAGRVVLNHYGPAGTVRTVQLEDVLDDRVAPQALAGRLVFIGATAESLRDLYATPFAADLPGVELLASLAGNLLQDRLVRRDLEAGLRSLVLAVLLAWLAWRAARLRRPLPALAASLAVWLAAVLLLQLAFHPGLLWLDAVTVLGATLFASALGGAARIVADAHAADRLGRERSNLSRHLSPVLAERLARDGPEGFRDRTQPAAVLFVDVAGYTGLAEGMEPAAVSAFLARLHRHVEEAVSACGGAIVEFLGDGVLAVFGLPEPRPEDAAQALLCGAALLDDRAPGYPAAADGRPVRLRVSVHHGPVALALVGGRQHGHVTVTGDTVNVAARLQEVAKQHGARFVASAEAVAAARDGTAAALPAFVPLAKVAMRGRRQATEVWVHAGDPPAAGAPHAPPPAAPGAASC